MRVCACGLMLVWALLLGGCGGSRSEPKLDPSASWGGYGSEEAWKEALARQAAEDAEQAPAAATAKPAKAPATTAPAQATATNATAPLKPTATPAPATAPQPPTPEAGAEGQAAGAAALALPEPPADFSTWSEGDYLTARLRHHSSLPEAVDVLTRQRSNERAGRILAGLLQLHLLGELWEKSPQTGNDSSADGAPDSRQGTPSHDAQLTEAIVAGLVRNNTPAARRALAQLLTGNLETRDKQAAARRALKVIAAQLDREEHEALLLALLAEPEMLGPPSTAGFSFDALQQETLTMVGQAASPELRLQVAKRLAKAGISSETRAQLAALLAGDTLENLEARAYLYQIGARGGPPEPSDMWFAELAAEALRQALGLSGDTAELDQSERARRLAACLWNAEFQRAVRRRLEQTDPGEATLRLASASPTEAGRATMTNYLEQIWLAGPGTLTTLWTHAETWTDPGLLVVLKHQRRKAEEAHAQAARAIRDPSGQVGSLLQQRQAAREGWDKVLDGLTAVWLERWREAVRQDGAAQASAATADLPFELHETAQLAAARQLQWSGSAAERATGMPLLPLEVRYLRFEEKARPEQLLAFYRRRLPGAEERRAAGGLRLSTLTDLPESGRQRSIDLQIVLARPDVPRLPNEAQDVVIELFLVETAAPGGAPLTASASDSR